jgi:hypothetical protein
VNLSLKSIRAPNKVHIGPVERIGTTIVRGNRLNALYARNHDEPTRIDLHRTSKCCLKSPEGMYNIFPGLRRPMRENKTRGKKISAPVKLTIKRTRITGLSFNTFFLTASYRPRKIAENNP